MFRGRSPKNPVCGFYSEAGALHLSIIVPRVKSRFGMVRDDQPLQICTSEVNDKNICKQRTDIAAPRNIHFHAMIKLPSLSDYYRNNQGDGGKGKKESWPVKAAPRR